MCTVGGGPDLGEVETLAAKDYECLECNNRFQGMGRRPMCPSCKSRNVKAVWSQYSQYKVDCNCKVCKGMHILLLDDEIAYLEGLSGTIAMAKTRGISFFLETETREIVLFTEPEDLIVASSFGVGEKVRRGLACTLYQLRELEAPLIVLPKGHPASPRLKTVVSIGPCTRLSCKIQPGTHPEQNVLCGSEEFHELEVLAEPGGAEIKGKAQGRALDPDRIIIEKL